MKKRVQKITMSRQLAKLIQWDNCSKVMGESSKGRFTYRLLGAKKIIFNDLFLFSTACEVGRRLLLNFPCFKCLIFAFEIDRVGYLLHKPGKS